MGNELISIIINVYNGEKFISKCLESVINQTYKNLEIVIVNDGSTDNTRSICESYEDKRINIINQKNMWLSLSRNVGIDNSHGKYIYFVDADDYIAPDTIEYLYMLIKKYKTSIATCMPIEIYDYNFNIKKRKEKIELLSGKDILDKILLSIDNVGTIWNKLIKKELFNDLRFEDRIVNDIVVTHKLVLKSNDIVYSNQIKYYYFKHQDSTLGRKRLEHSMDVYKAAIERYNYIDQIYPNLLENRICLNHIIVTLHLHDKSELDSFLKENEAYNLFNCYYSFRVIFSKMAFREKIKIVLFHISPNLCRFLVKIYLKIMGKI